MGKLKIITACVVFTALVACGDTTGKQALYGAAGGAVVGSVLGGDWKAGALLGAAGNVLACESGEVRCQ